MKIYTINENLLQEVIAGLKVYGQVATECTVEKLQSLQGVCSKCKDYGVYEDVDGSFIECDECKMLFKK